MLPYLRSYEAGVLLAFAWLLVSHSFGGNLRDLLSDSVQDFFDAPAAEQEIEALFHRLDEAVGKVATQEILASTQTHSYVPEMLPQSGGGHGLGKRTLRVHGSSTEVSWDLTCAVAELCSDSSSPAASN